MTSKKTRSLDAMLSEGLRHQAATAPMPDGLLDVPNRWVCGRPSMSASRGLAAAAVVVVAAFGTIAVLTLFAGMQPEPRLGSEDASRGAALPIEGFDVEPRPGVVGEEEAAAIGPVVDIARGRVDGRGFTVTVYRGAAPNDICLRFEWRPDYSHSCGSLPGESPAGSQSFGLATSVSDSLAAHEVSGVVATEVAAVWIETNDGGRFRAELIDLAPADIGARLFVAFLPGGVDPQAYVAADAAGNEIDRFDLLARPPDAASPYPTSPSTETDIPITIRNEDDEAAELQVTLYNAVTGAEQTTTKPFDLPPGGETTIAVHPTRDRDDAYHVIINGFVAVSSDFLGCGSGPEPPLPEELLIVVSPSGEPDACSNWP